MTKDIAIKILNNRIIHSACIEQSLWDGMGDVKRSYVLIHAGRINSNERREHLFNMVLYHTNGDGITIPLDTAIFIVGTKNEIDQAICPWLKIRLAYLE